MSSFKNKNIAYLPKHLKPFVHFNLGILKKKHEIAIKLNTY